VQLRFARSWLISIWKSHSTSALDFIFCLFVSLILPQPPSLRNSPASSYFTRAYCHRPTLLFRVLPRRILRQFPSGSSKQAIHREFITNGASYLSYLLVSWRRMGEISRLLRKDDQQACWSTALEIQHRTFRGNSIWHDPVHPMYTSHTRA
jgi:hypothetical protein